MKDSIKSLIESGKSEEEVFNSLTEASGNRESVLTVYRQKEVRGDKVFVDFSVFTTASMPKTRKTLAIEDARKLDKEIEKLTSQIVKAIDKYKDK